jgi:hypothetical protein
MKQGEISCNRKVYALFVRDAKSLGFAQKLKVAGRRAYSLCQDLYLKF